MIVFSVRGEPKGQPRPRAFARKIGGRYVARIFDAGTAEAWKSAIAMAARALVPPSPDMGPIILRLAFSMPRPKSHFLSGRLRADAPTWCTKKPDVDNLAKAVMDALTVCRFWRDDEQVCRIEASKQWEDVHALIPPGVRIEIEGATI
jgi:Holliday junction resolvase RusA-like endonuclease